MNINSSIRDANIGDRMWTTDTRDGPVTSHSLRRLLSPHHVTRGYLKVLLITSSI
jgi:hypothetical protein